MGILILLTKGKVFDAIVQVSACFLLLAWYGRLNSDLYSEFEEPAPLQTAISDEKDDFCYQDQKISWNNFQQINDHVDDKLHQISTIDKLRSFKRSLGYRSTWGSFALLKFW